MRWERLRVCGPAPVNWTAAVLAALLLGGLSLAAAGVPGAAQALPPQLGRSVYGVVLDARNRPISGAIVYLKNTSTKAIQTAITDDHGSYSFHQLAPHASFEVYAVWKRQRSQVRTDSEYNMQATLRLDLKIPVA